jgi:antitoxin ChpS
VDGWQGVKHSEQRYPGARANFAFFWERQKWWHLQAGATVGLAVDHGCLVLNPRPGPRYTLSELLAASDYSLPQPAQEREWVDAATVGGELL